MPGIPVALQLYTVRDVAADDFAGVVKQVADMGYTGVELAGNTGGMSPERLRSFLDDLGLKLAGSHIGLDALENELRKVIDENLALENPWVVCPYMPDDRRKDAEAALTRAEREGSYPEDARRARWSDVAEAGDGLQ